METICVQGKGTVASVSLHPGVDRDHVLQQYIDSRMNCREHVQVLQAPVIAKRGRLESLAGLDPAETCVDERLDGGPNVVRARGLKTCMNDSLVDELTAVDIVLHEDLRVESRTTAIDEMVSSSSQKLLRYAK